MGRGVYFFLEERRSGMGVVVGKRGVVIMKMKNEWMDELIKELMKSIVFSFSFLKKKWFKFLFWIFF